MERFILRALCGLAAVALLAISATPSRAQQGATFNFESLQPTYLSPPGSTPPGALTSLVLSRGGLTMWISREGLTPFDLVRNSGNESGEPSTWGLVSLDPLAVLNGGDWLFTFSHPIKEFRIEWGSYSLEEFHTLVLIGYDIYGDYEWDADQTVAFPLSQMSAVRGSALSSVRVSSWSANTFYLDNIHLMWGTPNDPTPDAPEPGSLALLAAGLAGIGALCRRRSQAVQS